MTHKFSSLVKDPNLVAFCGLYCGTCSKFKKGKCSGCNDNIKATWCKIRSCNIENGFENCSHCNMMNISDCKKLNNPIAKVFELVFRTDRLSSLTYIKECGEEAYAEKMRGLGQMSIKIKQNI